MANPAVVHCDGVEVADFDADVATHTAAIVDPELIHDLPPLAFLAREHRVVLHGHRHALDRAGTRAGLATGAERLHDRLIPQQDWKRPFPLRDLAMDFRILDSDRFAESRPQPGRDASQHTNHVASLLSRARMATCG